MTLAMDSQLQGFFLRGDMGNAAVDLDSSHRIINSFTEALQRNFKQDTRYARPLMPPQANILFALDKTCAHEMRIYMSEKLEKMGFGREEFRFVHKTGSEEDILQRLRLEFPHGVTAHLIRKLLIATDQLERVLPSFTLKGL